MKNAPATFQRLMNCITAGLSNVVTYTDDVVVYSGTWPEHTGHIKQLFLRLEEAGLVINVAKCELEKGQITYLGHQVGQGLVSKGHPRYPCFTGALAVDAFVQECVFFF